MKTILLTVAILATTPFAMAADESTTKSTTTSQSTPDQSAKRPDQVRNPWIGDGWCYSEVWGWREGECYEN